jgi:hypothetical protein
MECKRARRYCTEKLPYLQGYFQWVLELADFLQKYLGMSSKISKLALSVVQILVG